MRGDKSRLLHSRRPQFDFLQNANEGDVFGPPISPAGCQTRLQARHHDGRPFIRTAVHELWRTGQPIVYDI